MDSPVDTSGVGSDGNEDACRHCGLIGQLILCDNCPAAWHVRCAMKFDPSAAMGVLDQSASWFCPDCDGLSRQNLKRPRTNETAKSSDDRRLLLCSSDQRLYVLTTDNEAPKDIASAFGIDPLELLHFNKPRLRGLGSSSTLSPGTVVFVPEDAARQVAHKFNIEDDSDPHHYYLPGFPPPDRPPEPNVFVAEKIIGRRSKPKEEFLVKWEGFTEADATWEPRINILSDRLIVEFERQRSANAVLCAGSPSKLTFDCVVKRRDGHLGFALIGLFDSATSECICVVSSSGEETPLPEGLAIGDVVVAVDGRRVTHQPFERTLTLLAHSKTSVSLTMHRAKPS
jgi:hypothetical protein